ncbi:TonB-dependent receptor [Sphingomonas sp.]|uniref:TonB-dependent receptor n=1 Tax=Sphingomonas sp. TaxID=28214 RepID=UPI002DD6B12D|nr:TonB-dependent receptor [Sphingomonas sp.]
MTVQLGGMRGLLLAGVAAASVAAGAPALAQAPVKVALPAQTLADSLRQLAVQTGQEIMFAPGVVANRRAQPLSGNFEPREAIRRLVAPYGLTVEEAAPNVFVVKSPVRLSASGYGQRTASAGDESTAALAPAVLGMTGATAAQAVAAQVEGNGAVTGVVRGPDGNGVPGAVVRVSGTDARTVTDANGVYRLPSVPAGQRMIVLEYLGDSPQTLDVVVEPGRENAVNIQREVTQDVVVLGYMSSIQRALNSQKNSANSATVVSSDLLGQFPAETVSEALRRVPGVGFSRDASTGEGSQITVRGFTSEAIQVQLNGLDLQGTNFERSIDLSGFLADNIAEIRIEKSLLPSHEATGSGGLVRIETKSGLDYGRSAINLSFEAERNGRSIFGDEWQATGTFAKKLADNFGVSATVSYRETDRTNFDVGIAGTLPSVMPAGVTGPTLVPESKDFPYDAVFNRRLIQSTAYRNRDRLEKNLLASLNFAWDIGSHTRLRLDAQRNERDAVTSNAITNITFATGNYDMPIPELNGEIRRRYVLERFLPTIQLQSSDLRLESNSVSLRGTTRVDSLTVDYKAGWSRAVSRADNSIFVLSGIAATNLTALINPTTIVIHPDDDAARTPRVVDGAFALLPNGVPIPSLTALGISQVFNPANYNVGQSVRNYTNSPTTAWTAEFNGRYDFGGFVDYLKAGVKFDRSARASVDDSFNNTVSGIASSQTFAPISGRATSFTDFGGVFLSTPLSTIGSTDFNVPFLYNANALFARLNSLTVDDPSTAFNEQRFTYNDLRLLDPTANSSGLDRTRTTETRWAGYLEGHFRLGRFDMTGGARYERTTRVGNTLTTPTVFIPTSTFGAEPRTTFLAAGLVNFEDTGGTEQKITPSVLLNYRPTNDIVARFHYNMSTTNPDFRLIRRAASYTVDLRPSQNRAYIREANPDLKPQRVHNFEIGLSHYFDKPAGVIGAAVFYKITTNNFTNVAFEDRANDTVRQRILDYFGPLVVARPDLFSFNSNTVYQLNRPENGEGGTIWGVEAEVTKQLNFLPGFLKNFGVMGNITYTTGDFPTLVQGRNDAGALTNYLLNKPLAEASALTYNASLNYSAKGLEARLIYTHQDASVPASGYNPNDLNSIIPDYSTLDMRVSYAARVGGKLITIFVEGDDLLSGSRKPDIRSAVASAFDRKDASYFFPNTLQFNGGRTFTLGIRGNF